MAPMGWRNTTTVQSHVSKTACEKSLFLSHFLPPQAKNSTTALLGSRPTHPLVNWPGVKTQVAAQATRKSLRLLSFVQHVILHPGRFSVSFSPAFQHFNSNCISSIFTSTSTSNNNTNTGDFLYRVVCCLFLVVFCGVLVCSSCST